MKRLFEVCGLIVVILVIMIMSLALHQGILAESDANVPTQVFEGILHSVVYCPAQGEWVLTFIDGRIIIVSQQPREGWLIARLYVITITPSGTSVNRVKELQSERPQKDKKNPYPGKAF